MTTNCVTIDTETAKEEVFFSIERTRVPIMSRFVRSLSRCAPLGNGWPLICIYVIILAIASLSLVIYLKAMGEWMPFCLYDNWYYIAHYLFLCIFCAVLIPTADFDLFPPTSHFWQWTRRLGAYSLFVELEGMAYVLVFYKDIAYEVEFDDEAQVIVWTMAALGAFRLIAVAFAYYLGADCLERIRRRNKLATDYFGKTITDLLDILIFQMIVQTLYYYELSLYSISFTLSATYLYIVWARI